MDYHLLCSATEASGLIMSNNAGYVNDLTVVRQSVVTATSMIAQHIRRPLTRGVHKDVFNLPRSRGTPFRLWTRAIPVVDGSLTSKFHFKGNFADGDALTSDELTVVDLERGIIDVRLWLEDNYPNSLQLTYTGGWDVAGAPEVVGADNYYRLDVPQALSSACATQAAFLVDRTLRSQTGTKEGGVNREILRFGLTPEVISLVAPYQTPRYRGV